MHELYVPGECLVTLLYIGIKTDYSIIWLIFIDIIIDIICIYRSISLYCIYLYYIYIISILYIYI